MPIHPWLLSDVLPLHPYPGEWAYLGGDQAIKTTLSELLLKIEKGPGRAPFSGEPVNVVPVFVAAPDSARFVPVVDHPALCDDWLAVMKPGIQQHVMLLVSIFPIAILGLVSIFDRDEASAIPILGFILLGLFVLVPWIFSSQRRRDRTQSIEDWRQQLMFSYWNATRPESRVSIVNWIVMAWVGILLVQWMLRWIHPNDEVALGVSRGALDPALWLAEPWRLLTATMMHGGLFHIVANVSAVASVVSVLDVTRFRHLSMTVWILGAIGGSLLSAPIGASPSLGASGGVLALIAFLVTIGWSSRPQFPGFLMSSLGLSIGFTLALGFVGWHYIDNAAHLGGAVVGVLLGLLARSDSESIWVDSVARPTPWWTAVANGMFASMTVLTLAVLLWPS